MDLFANLCKVTVNQGYDASATSITITPTDPNLSLLPTPTATRQYDLTWWDETNYPDPTEDPNKEIVRVTSKTSNVLTVTRAQGGTVASTKNTANATYKMALTFNKRFADDIEAASVDVGDETKYATEETSTGGAGAAGDGVTIDTTAIQDHVTNGNLVIFPPGTYLINAEITLHSNLTLRGSGMGGTTIKLANTSGAVNMFKGTSIANLVFEDLTLDGNKANNGSALDGIQLVTSSDMVLRNVELKNCKRHGVNLGANACTLDSCRASGADSSGIYVDGDNNVIRDSRISSNGVGITVNTGADDTLIAGCFFASNTTKVTNNGTNTHARGNVGWKTATVVESTDLSGTTGGSSPVSTAIAHGLDLTPDENKCNVSLRFTVNPSATMPNIRGPFVESTDATNVTTYHAISVNGDNSNTFRIVVTIDALP